MHNAHIATSMAYETFFKRRKLPTEKETTYNIKLQQLPSRVISRKCSERIQKKETTR